MAMTETTFITRNKRRKDIEHREQGRGREAIGNKLLDDKEL